MSLSRRNFLRGSSGALALAGAAAGLRSFSFFESAASAATLDGYRALVGVFLLGGNDSNNLIVPYNTTGPSTYAQYAAVRPTTNVGIAKTDLNAINPDNMVAAAYGLHPSFTKLASIFNDDRKLAVVCNVGPLVKATTLADFQNKEAWLPENLFSHSDQQDAWATAIPDPLASGGARTGWGGRIADKIAAANPIAYPPVTWYGGRNVFGVGQPQTPISIASNGTLSLGSSGNGTVNAARLAALNQMATLNSGAAPLDAFSGIFASALANAGKRAAAITGNPLPAAVEALFPNTGLGQQLLHIAEDLLAGASAAGNGLGMKRQIFSAAIGGFDTHSDQIARQKGLYDEMDDAFAAFYEAIEALNDMIADGALPGVTQPLQVTLFTMSDFGRTFVPNATLGSDHGWGSHMLVLGNQVKGGAIYGTFPKLLIGGPNDCGQGRWLPTTSEDQYANTLAYWFGITAAADRNYVFPKIANFTKTRLTFMNA